MPINNATVSGNLTKDAAYKQSQAGTGILTFTVAINEKHKNARGEYVDEAYFMPCVLFGSRADALKPYLLKGTKIVVSGKLKQNAWTDQQTGQKRDRWEIICDRVEFLSRKNDNQPAQQYQPHVGQGYQQPYDPQQPMSYEY